jgi:hypothetical protein
MRCKQVKFSERPEKGAGSKEKEKTRILVPSPFSLLLSPAVRGSASLAHLSGYSRVAHRSDVQNVQRPSHDDHSPLSFSHAPSIDRVNRSVREEHCGAAFFLGLQQRHEVWRA